GATAFTRISGPSTLASSTVRWLSPALDTAYGIELPVGRSPATELMLMTAPSPDSRRAGTQARVMCQGPSTFTPKIRSQTSSVAASRSACGMSCVVPALLTSTSIRPNSAWAAAASATQALSSATSACTYMALGSVSATAWPAAADFDEL